MRPYGSLIFSGAFALTLLTQPTQPKTKWVALSLLFVHLYGICFIAWALLRKRRFILSAFGFAYVFLILFFSYKPLVLENRALSPASFRA